MVTISNVADKPVTRGFCMGNTLGVVTLGPLMEAGLDPWKQVKRGWYGPEPDCSALRYKMKMRNLRR